MIFHRVGLAIRVIVTRSSSLMVYQWVRHPMYLAVIVSAVSVPLVLASYWALIPGLMVALVITYRTAREDRMLMEKLPGYKEFSLAVRYRLIPGIW